MARKYRRDRRGRFAGGGGGTKVTAARPGPTAKQRARRKKILVGSAVGVGALAGAVALQRNKGRSAALRAAEAAARRLAKQEGYSPGLTAGLVRHHRSRAALDRKARLGRISKAKYVKKRGLIHARAARDIRLHR